MTLFQANCSRLRELRRTNVKIVHKKTTRFTDCNEAVVASYHTLTWTKAAHSCRRVTTAVTLQSHPGQRNATQHIGTNAGRKTLLAILK